MKKLPIICAPKSGPGSLYNISKYPPREQCMQETRFKIRQFERVLPKNLKRVNLLVFSFIPSPFLWTRLRKAKEICDWLPVSLRVAEHVKKNSFLVINHLGNFDLYKVVSEPFQKLHLLIYEVHFLMSSLFQTLLNLENVERGKSLKNLNFLKMKRAFQMK